MLTVEHSVGRLVLVRIMAPVVLADVQPFEQQLGAALRQVAQRGQRVIGCTDLTGATVFSPEVSEAFILLLRRDNAVLERSAFLIGPLAMFALQIERMLKQSGHPMRRTFREPPQLISWLGEPLTPEETAHLRSFLQKK